jgi:hypothetical protein
MSLAANLLEKLVKWKPDSARATLEVADAGSGWTAALSGDCVDQVGCRLWEVALRREKPAEGDLAARAAAVAARVTGLLEPLRVLEVDPARGTALLRSEAPGHYGDGRFYYELTFQADGAASVRRYQAPHDGEPRRQQVTFNLTHEALGKLVGDLTA